MTTTATPRSSGRDRVQAFGRFLSSMVMPNIGAFIAWGLITALFIPTGWTPNERLSGLVGPMIRFLLPLLLAYTGGRIVHDHRGGVLGAIAAMGVIIGAGETPMFIGAMVMGPLGGWVIKQFDRLVAGRIKPGFEMLVNNFSAGIIGAILAIIGFYTIGPFILGFTRLITSGVTYLVEARLLPLVSLFIEPGKILFLNNAINHGILTPLGAEQARTAGRSIAFLLEANPGPGLGLLLAYWVFAKGAIRSSAPGAIIIQFFGGIHEVYFPYVLMRPILFLAVIGGGMAGVLAFTLTGAGLVSAASPGSIFAILALTPRGGYFSVLAGVVSAAAVSFLLASIFLRNAPSDEDLEQARAASRDMKGAQGTAVAAASATPGYDLGNRQVRKVVFACDAGMGSSAMGATSFRKKVQAAGLPIEVTNTAIENIPTDADLVVTQRNLTSRAQSKAPNARHVSIDNFINNPLYDTMIADLKSAETAQQSPVPDYAKDEVAQVMRQTDPQVTTTVNSTPTPTGAGNTILRHENIVLNQPTEPKEEAIRKAGELLVRSGYVQPSYIAAMYAREKLTSTYIGNGVAIPHGVDEAKKDIMASGIVVLQYPNGVDFEGGRAHLVIGIAGVGNEHLQILSRIAEALEEEATVQRLARTTSADEIYRTFTR